VRSEADISFEQERDLMIAALAIRGWLELE
jgi:hypothetical protein